MIEAYVAVLDREAVHRNYEPLVWVTLDEVTRASMTQFEQAVQEVPEIVEAMRMMGQPDYLLRLATENASTFEALYIDTLAGLPHVHKLTRQLAMKVIKRTLEVPL